MLLVRFDDRGRVEHVEVLDVHPLPDRPLLDRLGDWLGL
jgi:hypothetical protein